MALESLAALGLASNIVQFVDFGCRLFSQSKELYRSSNGLKNEAVELKNITRSLGRLSNDLMVGHSFKIQPSTYDPDAELEDNLPIEPTNASEKRRDEVDLMLIAKDCKQIADELSDALNQLKVKGTGKKWRCFRVTLKRIWKPEKIDEMARRMKRFDPLFGQNPQVQEIRSNSPSLY